MESSAEVRSHQRKMIGYPTPGLLLIALGVSLLGGVWTVQTAMDAKVSLASALGNAAGYGAVVAFLWTLMASSVDVYGITVVRINNAVVYVELPVAQIEEVDTSHGLAFLSSEGKAFRSIAYGRSLIGEFTGYRRSRRVAERYRRMVGTAGFTDFRGSFAWEQPRWKIRWSMLGLDVLIISTSVVVAALAYLWR